VELGVATRFSQQLVMRHCLTPVRESRAEEHGSAPAVRVIVSLGLAEPQPGPHVSAVRVAAPPRQASAPPGPKIGHLVADYTFETFVVGRANEVAYQAARAVAAMPGRRFNPF